MNFLQKLTSGAKDPIIVGKNGQDLLTGMGLDVLLDDREERPGVKFKDADLVGLPMQVVVGGKGLARGIVEVKNRKTGEKGELPVEGFAEAFAAWRKGVLACWGM